MLDSYRRILTVPGALSFSGAAMVARMPISMVGLGIVLLVQQTTGSYGRAGAVSAVYVAASAGFAIVQGRLLDRYGQARILVPVSLLFAAALGLLVVLVRLGWAPPAWYLLAAVAGAALPSAGSCVRARWSHVLQGRPAQLQTAFALEAVVDEAVFILGPILVTALATSVSPIAGLGTALVTGTVGSLLLAAQRATEPPPRPERQTGDTGARLPWATLVPLLAVVVGLGTALGAAEVVTVAFAEERGSQGYAGPLLALWAFGSLLAGLATGAIHWRRGPAARLRFGALGLFASMCPLPWIEALPAMGLVLFLGGFAIAPSLIAATSLVERSMPPGRLTEGMALLHTGVVAGVAPGAALAGRVVDAAGSSSAYVVAVAAGLVAVLAALGLPRERAQ
ncbi:MFS transporter [Nocardioides sp. GXQ0305]|uniref:MFS transporter n=1 Tax=Nocardioides sp. GXQ0305 TaxID=3423912 RepID=UPI003D7DE69F